MKPACCAFYGFRWPERTTNLVEVGGDACGLDLEQERPCELVSQGKVPDFRHCEIAAKAKPFLHIIGSRIRFIPLQGTTVLYSACSDQVRRREL